MKHFKNFFSLILMFFISFTLISCSKDKTNNSPLSSDYSANETLVAYFSCTNNTKRIANYIEDYTNGTLFEITPTIPYTNEDLQYNNSSSRTYLEDLDNNARPEIANQIENIENYKIIFLGYPIWFGKAPKIIYTFLETYGDSLNETIIIPFCTSASSGIGNSATNVHSLAPNAEWKSGKKFSSSTSKNEVETWLRDELNFTVV